MASENGKIKIYIYIYIQQNYSSNSVHGNYEFITLLIDSFKNNTIQLFVYARMFGQTRYMFIFKQFMYI